MQMSQNRQRMQQTLEADYKGIDKLFKEQLIKTKVRPQLQVKPRGSAPIAH